MGVKLKTLEVTLLWCLLGAYILAAYVVSVTWLWPFMDDYWNIIQFGGVLGALFILEAMTGIYLRVERLKLHKMMVDQGLIVERVHHPESLKKKKPKTQELLEALKEELKEDPDLLDEIRKGIREEEGK